MAARALKYCWETRIATTIEVQRHHDVDMTIARIGTFCSMLQYAPLGNEP